MRNSGYIGTRWLGVGLAAVLAVVTISLAVTGRLGLFINPDSTWFAVSMALLVLAGAVASFALPLGAEADHGHDHGDARARDASSRESVAERAPARRSVLARSATGSVSGSEVPDASSRSFLARSATGTLSDSKVPVAERAPARRSAFAHADHDDAHDHDHAVRHPAAVAATVIGGVAASGVVVLTLVLPPASLSAELAMSRDVGATPLFGGADTIQLASTGDTASFGVGEWATVFATATNPDAFDGDTVELTGFVTPGDDGAFDLTRLVITHCVIDAQPASLPIDAATDVPDTGQWVTITGTVRSSSDGRLVVDADDVEQIPEPEDPYEY